MKVVERVLEWLGVFFKGAISHEHYLPIKREPFQSINLERPIMTSIKTAPITWHVDRLMCECGGEFKHTVNISYAEKPFGHVCEKCSAFEATEYIYPRTVWVES